MKCVRRLHFEAEIHFEHILQKLHFSSFMEIRFKMFSSFHSTETLLQVKDRPAHLGPADASVSTVEELLVQQRDTVCGLHPASPVFTAENNIFVRIGYLL